MRERFLIGVLFVLMAVGLSVGDYYLYINQSVPWSVFDWCCIILLNTLTMTLGFTLISKFEEIDKEINQLEVELNESREKEEQDS